MAFLGLQGAAAAPSKRRARHVSVPCLQVAEMELLHVESADIFIPYGMGRMSERECCGAYFTHLWPRETRNGGAIGTRERERASERKGDGLTPIPLIRFAAFPRRVERYTYLGLGA